MFGEKLENAGDQEVSKGVRTCEKKRNYIE